MEIRLFHAHVHFTRTYNVQNGLACYNERMRDALEIACLADKAIRLRLTKELWVFGNNRIAVRFAYEWHDDSGNWFCSYGNENW
jgi:nuclear transport factor 2 (NTF2) superfamily protein